MLDVDDSEIYLQDASANFRSNRFQILSGFINQSEIICFFQPTLGLEAFWKTLQISSVRKADSKPSTTETGWCLNQAIWSLVGLWILDYL